MTSSNILTALIVNGQIPLDGKTYFLTLSSMINLGTGDQNAFKYYEGMEAYCNENKKKYVWREVLQEESPENPGLIAGHYTYPAGALAEGINYAGRSFNFFETGELTFADIQNFITATGIKEIKYLPTDQAYKDLVAANQDDAEILYLTPEAEQPAWLST